MFLADTYSLTNTKKFVFNTLIEKHLFGISHNMQKLVERNEFEGAYTFDVFTHCIF